MAPPWGLLGQVVSSEPTVAERDKVYEAAATAGGDPMRASNFGLSRLELGARQQARADELDHTVPVVLIRWVLAIAVVRMQRELGLPLLQESHTRIEVRPRGAAFVSQQSCHVYLLVARVIIYDNLRFFEVRLAQVSAH